MRGGGHRATATPRPPFCGRASSRTSCDRVTIVSADVEERVFWRRRGELRQVCLRCRGQGRGGGRLREAYEEPNRDGRGQGVRRATG